MKKKTALLLCVILTFCALSSCAAKEAERETKTTESTVQSVSDVTENASVTTGTTTEEQTTCKPDKSVDIDLTALSSTMVYSEVINMMENPEDYISKKVKMRGELSTYENLETGEIFYACVVADATACCQQGIEFKLRDEAKGYPALGTKIEVVGIFNTYMDGNAKYCRLEKANMKILKEAQ